MSCDATALGSPLPQVKAGHLCHGGPDGARGSAGLRLARGVHPPWHMRPLLLLVIVGTMGCGDDAPWRDTSERVSIRAGSQGAGSLRIEADRATLTAAQRELLARLERAVPGAPCPEDMSWIELRIGDADGSTAEYEANEMGCPRGRELVEYGTAAELVRSFGCRFASETRRAHRTRADALTFWPSRACHHGISVPAEPDEVWLGLDVAAPGTYRVSASDCAGWGVDASIYDSAGAALLAAGGPGTGEACAVAEHRFAAPGMAKIKLAKGATGPAGDLYVNIRRVD